VAYAIADASLTVAGQWRIFTALPEHRASGNTFYELRTDGTALKLLPFRLPDEETGTNSR
jgi:hypothetical protein